MPRKLRIHYPGAICHLMNCGARREGIRLNTTKTATRFKVIVRKTSSAILPIRPASLMD